MGTEFYWEYIFFFKIHLFSLKVRGEVVGGVRERDTEEWGGGDQREILTGSSIC